MRRSNGSNDGVCRLAFLGCVGLLLAGAQFSWSQVRTEGAEITASRIVVNQASHWAHWTLPTHAVDLVDDHVEFHYFRSRFNVLEDLATYQREIPAIAFRDKFKDRKGVGASQSVPTVGRRFTYDDEGELRLRGDLKMEKYLDTHYLRYPGSETHVAFDGDLFVITDTSMTSTKAGVMTLRNVATGAVSTRDFATKDKNAVPVYQHFSRMGISRVGSNPPAAGALFDGDGTTYWEPAAEDSLSDWWIEVDLGRSIVVDQIVLKFVDEELGDPFRQFKVSAVPWQEPILEETSTLGRSILHNLYSDPFGLKTGVETGLAVVGGTRSANEDQRQFIIDLEPQADAEPNWTGRMVQTIRIVVFDTKGGRHTQLSPSDQGLAQAQWEALAEGDKGDVVYFVRDQEGFEQPETKEQYERLPEERQGRREYYRRERPRLADMEVWGRGDNLSPSILAGGGSLQVEGVGIASAAAGFDANYRTVYSQKPTTQSLRRDLLTVDLGATFWLEQVRIMAKPVLIQTHGEYFEGYIHYYSDGTRDPTGGLRYERLSPFEREDITSPDIMALNNVTTAGGHYYWLQDDYPWAPKVRYLEARIAWVGSGTPTGEASIREYLLYTRAYPAEVVLESDLFALPSVQNFGRIFWDAETPLGTRLEVRTRSGDRIGRIVNYYHKSGEFWTHDESVWQNLGPNKGGTDTTFVPTAAAWSPWSNPYASSDAWVTSPGGRRFMQVQVKMITEDRETAPTLHGLEIELTPPVGERIVAEVRPALAVAGVVDTFEVFILPNFIEGQGTSASAGFDELLLQLSSGSMELLDLGLGVDAETGTAAQLFAASGAGFVDEGGAVLEVLRGAGDSLWVRFPVQNLQPEAVREYRRITAEGDQVPTDAEGFALTAAAWGLLEEAEQGVVRYFRRRDDQALTEVANQGTYEALAPSEQGPIRYFRILQGAGESVPFDTVGDTLTASIYNRLSPGEQGPVVGSGELMRLRYAAAVFRNGTTVEVAVRHSEGESASARPWQGVEAGDATALVTSNTLSIALPLGAAVLDQVALHPNPFSPNGDGVNDAVRIGFSVFKISAAREVTVSVYTLAGRRVWERAQMIASGQESVEWTGVDMAGARVPPGLYLCKVALDVDSEDQGGTTIAKIVAVAY